MAAPSTGQRKSPKHQGEFKRKAAWNVIQFTGSGTRCTSSECDDKAQDKHGLSYWAFEPYNSSSACSVTHMHAITQTCGGSEVAFLGSTDGAGKVSLLEVDSSAFSCVGPRHPRCHHGVFL